MAGTWFFDAMPLPTHPQMLTANALQTGDVLYRKGLDWVPYLKDGEVYGDPAAAQAALAAATAELTRNIVVSPYLFEVRETDGEIVPVKEREIIRAAGPTVHPHTGKQAEGGASSPAAAGEVPVAGQREARLSQRRAEGA